MSESENAAAAIPGSHRRRAVHVERFLEQQADRVTGVLEGFDRILFRGSEVTLGSLDGMNRKQFVLGVRYDRLFDFFKQFSAALKEHAQKLVAETGRPLIPLNSTAACKEDLARDIQRRDGIEQGLIYVLICLEPCQTYALRRWGERDWLTLVPKPAGASSFVFISWTRSSASCTRGCRRGC